MIQKLEGREKIQPHKIANRLNEVIELLNTHEIVGDDEDNAEDENAERGSEKE